MKATLSFKLPEENEEFQLAQNGMHYSNVIDELDNFLRSKLKYETLSEIESEVYKAVRDKLWELKGNE
jgi:hypothetical protein